VELNAQDLWSGQSISVETLLSLRNLRQDQALQLLGSLDFKGRVNSIQNPNNYVQAAVVKIEKSKAAVVVPPPNWNYAGNQTRNKAVELGLHLEESALKRLARQPMNEAISILEAAACMEDPNEFVHSEVSQLEAAEASESNAAPWRATTTFVEEEYAEPGAAHHSMYGQAHHHHSGYDDGLKKVQHHEVRRRAVRSHLETAMKRTRRS